MLGGARRFLTTMALACACLSGAPEVWANPLPTASPANEQDPEMDPQAALEMARDDFRLARDNSARASALAVQAGILSKLGKRDEADSALSSATRLTQTRDQLARADILFSRSQLLFDGQDYQAAIAPLQEARTIWANARGENSLEVARTDAQLALVDFSLSHFPEGLVSARRAWASARAKLPAGHRDRVGIGHILATGLTRAREIKEAEPLLRSLIGEAEALPAGHPLRARLPMRLGIELLMQGRVNAAIPLLRMAVDASLQSPTLPSAEKANILGVMGNALLQQDIPGDALPYFEQSAALFGEAGLVPAQASALTMVGTAADRAGDRARGLQLREKGMAVLAQLSAQSELATALNRFKLAQSYAHVGRLEEADVMAKQAVDVLTRLRPETHFQNTNSRISRGWIATLRGRTAEGLDLVRAAFRSSVATNNSLEVVRHQVVGVLDNIEAYSQALQTAVLAGDHEFAFEVLQVMVETDASRAALAVTAREEAGDTELGKLLRQRQEAAIALAEADSALLGASPEGPATDLTSFKATLENAATALSQIDRSLDAGFPGFRALLRPRAVSLAETQARLARDETLLIVEDSDLGVYTMAVSRKQVAIGHAAIRREALRALVNRVRAGIDDGDPAQFDVEAAADLHDAVFTPAIRSLVRKGTRLRLVTGDILSALPFSLLASKAGKNASDTRWLIEDHPISVLPSIAAMQSEGSFGPVTGRFIGIGAPLLAAASSAPGLTSRAGSLAPLPGAARELAQVATLLSQSGAKGEILQGAAATEQAVRAVDYSDVGVLLFATHGLVAGRFDGDEEPALVLTPPTVATGTSGEDGLLTASEAASMRLNVDWVILSACDTAGGNHPSAAGYTGLARAFLFAGARRVVASHWPVRDDVSARLSVGIVSAARQGLAPDEALRRSVLSLMRDRSVPEARDPANWAPFMVVSR